MPPRERDQALPRRHRYTTQGSFAPILQSGRKVRGPNLVLHSLPGAARIGVAVGRRAMPRAVDRNRLKRIVREAFRRHPLKHSGLDCIVALRARLDEAARRSLAREVSRLFDALQAARTA